jgi:transposase
MGIWVGIDIAKEVHWATGIDDRGQVVLDQQVANDPDAIDALIRTLDALADQPVIGLDLLGGIATLLQAMLGQAGFRLVHVPGLAVNRARQATSGGQHKSDPRDARVIADQVRTRPDLRPITADTELNLEIRLLVGRRSDLTGEQTRRIARLHELLSGVHPGLERALDLTTKTGLSLLTRWVTPAQLRQAGRDQIRAQLASTARLPSRRLDTLADQILAAANAQQLALPGEQLAATLIAELAHEALACRDRLARLDRDLAQLLDRHPDAALICSLPGMGATLCAEFIAQAGPLTRFRSADALAAAAGLAPVLRQSGKVRYNRRPTGGSKALKRVFYQSAFCSLRAPDSKAFYARKRREGKPHHQAVIALARRRIDVLWAMLHTRQAYQPGHTRAA